MAKKRSSSTSDSKPVKASKSSKGTSGTSSKAPQSKSVKDAIAVSVVSSAKPPLVASFTNGVVANTSSLKFSINYATEPMPTILGTSDSCTFSNATTTTYNEASEQVPLLSSFVCVFDRNKNSLTLHAPEGPWEEGTKTSSCLLALSQTVKDYVPSVTPSDLDANQERRNSLYQSFGSSKKMKVLKSQQANKVDINAVVDGHMMLDNMGGVAQSEVRMGEHIHKSEVQERSEQGGERRAANTSEDELRGK